MDFKINLMSAAFNKEELNMNAFLKQSKYTIVDSVVQHYNSQIPILKYEIDELEKKLQQTCDQKRYESLRQDLNYFRK
jgi:phage host-nuclease inhibitor protein Gam